jgi:hypothetical protein
MKVLDANINDHIEIKTVFPTLKKYLIWAIIAIFVSVAIPKIANYDMKIHLYTGCSSASCVNHRFYWTFPGTNMKVCLPC